MNGSSAIKITYSEIRSWKNCREEHRLGYVEHLTSTTPKSYFRLGDFVHRYIDAIYKEVPGTTIETLVNRLEKEWLELAKLPNQFDNEDDVKTDLATIQGMVLGYHDAFFCKEKFEGVITEKELEVRFDGFTFGGKLDGIVKMNGDYWVMEHKTASSFSETDRRLLSIDDQTTQYMVLAQEAFGKPFAGSIRNILKKPTIKQTKKETLDEYCVRLVNDYRTRPEHYFIRVLVPRTQEEVASYRKYMKVVAIEIQTGPVFKSPSRDCGMCQFMELCTEREEAVRVEILDTKFRVRSQKHQELAAVLAA